MAPDAQRAAHEGWAHELWDLTQLAALVGLRISAI
jgi:hypothetical protein